MCSAYLENLSTQSVIIILSADLKLRYSHLILDGLFEHVEPSHLILGKQAESLAAAFLKDKGFTILARNWKNRFEEIDIVAEKADILVVVEVKARKNKKYGMPYDQVGLKKQRLLVNAAEAYILKSDIHKETRFDIISIVFNTNGFELRHIERAFSPFD